MTNTAQSRTDELSGSLSKGQGQNLKVSTNRNLEEGACQSHAHVLVFVSNKVKSNYRTKFD